MSYAEKVVANTESIQPNSLTDIDPQTIEVYEGIRTGTFSALQLQWLLDRDPLIDRFLGIRGFERRLEYYLKKRIKGVLIAIDVDDFKLFNDSQGHPAGDSLLKRSAKILFEQTRVSNPTAVQQELRHHRDEEKDLLGRTGGDEFSVFLVDASMHDAVNAAIRIRHHLADAVRQEFPGYGSDQTMSLGLSAVQPEDTIETIRRRADKALYLAKNGKASIPQEAIVIL